MAGDNYFIDVLKDVVSRFEKLGLDYMLTGSVALGYYSIPRSTVDIDIVLNLTERDLQRFIAAFDGDYYIPIGSARRATSARGMFNLIHQRELVKIDCVLLKSGNYETVSFSRRQEVEFTRDMRLWLISREDLIIAKLDWSRKSGSERQIEDVAGILANADDLLDQAYLNEWTVKLGLGQQLETAKSISDRH